MRFTLVWSVLAAVAVGLSACGGGSKPGATATTQPQATATPVPGSIELKLLTAGAPPAGSTLFTVSGCFQCDGPDTGLQRQDVLPDGSLRTTTLLPSSEWIVAGWTIGMIGAEPDASLLWASTCSVDYCGGLGNVRPTSSWRVFWSFDQGVSWSVAFAQDVSFAVVAAAADGRLVAETITPGGPPATIRYYLVDKSGSIQIQPPAQAGPFPEPQLLNDGAVMWVETADDSGARRRIFRADGTELALATRPGAEIAYASVAQAPTGELIVGTLDATTGLYGFDVYARPGGPLAGSYALPGAYRFAAWDERFLLANMTGYDVGTGDDGTSYPVLVDRNAGTAQPFVSDVFTKQRGRNRFVAFVPGAPVP